MRARRRQRRCRRLARHVSAQLNLYLLPASTNEPELFLALRACAREDRTTAPLNQIFTQITTNIGATPCASADRSPYYARAADTDQGVQVAS